MRVQSGGQHVHVLLASLAAVVLGIALCAPQFTALQANGLSATVEAQSVEADSRISAVGNSDEFALLESSLEDYVPNTIDDYTRLQTPNTGSTSAKVKKQVIQFKNGDSYTGYIKNGKMSGKGTYTFANGSKVSGTFANNKVKKGTYKTTDSKGRYSFTIKSGKITKANITLRSGFKYKGGFSSKKLHGTGTAKYKNGDVYKGKYVKGKRSGKGTYTWSDGAKYSGAWAKDAMSGKGTYYYPKTSKAKKLTGKFSANKPNGTCTYYLRNGEHYKTVWKNGKCRSVS